MSTSLERVKFELARKSVNRALMGEIDEMNTCCNVAEKKMIIDFGLELKDKYPDFFLQNIFTVLIFSYYGHNLLEQSGYDLYSKDLIGSDEILKQTFDTIYFKIGSSDEPIFKKIRRAFLGFEGGRRKNRRHKRTKRGGTNKSKTRRHKRRHTRKH